MLFPGIIYSVGCFQNCSWMNAAWTPAPFALLFTGCSFCYWFSFPGLVPHPSSPQGTEVLPQLQKEEMLSLWLGAAAARVQLLLWYFCTLSEPGQLVSGLAEKLGKVLLIPELSVLLLKIGYSRKQAWSINLILMVYG